MSSVFSRAAPTAKNERSTTITLPTYADKRYTSYGDDCDGGIHLDKSISARVVSADMAYSNSTWFVRRAFLIVTFAPVNRNTTVSTTRV